MTRTLADIFGEEPEQEQEKAPRKQPAVYRCYQGGDCLNCGQPLGVIEVEGGRDRLYCDNNGKCRVAYNRKRKREQKREQERAQTLQQDSNDIKSFWQRNGIRGEVLHKLQEILMIYGKPPAWAATDAVLLALKAQEQAEGQYHFRLIDEVMQAGAAIGFGEVRLDEFRISAGVDAWSLFVNLACDEYLMLAKAYLCERQHEPECKALARKRLMELGHTKA